MVPPPCVLTGLSSVCLDYALKVEILENGFERLYSNLTEFLSDTLPNEESLFVRDVLDLYEDAHFGFSKLSDDEKNEELEYAVKFNGFDLNDEKQSALLSYADFMINRYGRWSYLRQLIQQKGAVC